MSPQKTPALPGLPPTILSDPQAPRLLVPHTASCQVLWSLPHSLCPPHAQCYRPGASPSSRLPGTSQDSFVTHLPTKGRLHTVSVTKS